MIWMLMIFSIIPLSKCDIPRIRGVSISKTSLYPPGEYFTCLDGSRIIKYLQVNDDFCDCPDNSDEPGTSACPEGSFHCINLHHRPKNIGSSRVNDGICDCCDASDEYNSSIRCENTCMEMGREEREKTKAHKELLKKGGIIKNEMEQRGKNLKAERESKLLELEKRRSEAEAIKFEKEKIKSEIEILENEALSVYREIEEKEKAKQLELVNEEAVNAFSSYDYNIDGVVDIPEIQAHMEFDKDNDGEVSEHEALYFLDEKENVDLEYFKTNSWSKIKPQLMVKKDGVFSPPEERYSEEGEEVSEPQDEEEYEEGDETGQGEIEEQHSKAQESIEYDQQTQQLINQANQARNELSEAERVIRELENEIKNLKEIESKDYGKTEEFAPLAGECFEFEDREYIYKLCPFDRASQQPKNGGTETRLGTWDKWSGSYEEKYNRMLYNKGATCWNGPQRSADVHVECGLENKIVAVSEPNRCEYSITFQTPAACKHLSEHHSENHDEL